MLTYRIIGRSEIPLFFKHFMRGGNVLCFVVENLFAGAVHSVAGVLLSAVVCVVLESVFADNYAV